ncbi:Uncharacterised protein [Raoultella terrigena]|jgi:hypothetical protein|nr:Uncharacterised protein [Raoultella terrigena]VTM14434.1 Uncharacterised protein [Raoultella terrigena]
MIVALSAFDDSPLRLGEGLKENLAQQAAPVLGLAMVA